MTRYENRMFTLDYPETGPIPAYARARCHGCGRVVHEDDLEEWAGERRCEDCRWWCVECEDVRVLSEGEICEECAAEIVAALEGK